MKQTNNFKQTEIGMIPEDWRIEVVGTLVKINEDTINKNYQEENIEYIDTSSVDKGHLVRAQKLNLKEAPSRAKRIIKDHDILISTVRPNLKHFFFVDKSKKNLVASTGFAVISSKNIFPKFLYYYLTTDSYTNFLSSIADSHTSTYPSFNPDVIENSFCPRPKENEQQAIAKILSDLDSKIEINQRMNKTLEAIGQTIFKHWFVDFEFPNEEGNPYKRSGGEMVESELGEIPKGWKVLKMENIAKKKKNSIVDGPFGTQLHSDEYIGEGIPVIRVINTSFEGRFINSKLVYISEEKSQELVRSVVFPNDILLAKTGATIGKFAMVPEYLKKGIIASSILKISPSEHRKNKYFIFNFIKRLSDKKYWEKISAGSTRPTINLSDVRKISLICPSDQLMIDYDTVVNSFYSKLEKNEKESTKLSQIRDSLLPKLMSGKIRVHIEVRT
ncbi:MAG: restriction endonuclease subunit S [archaeon]